DGAAPRRCGHQELRGRHARQSRKHGRRLQLRVRDPRPRGDQQVEAGRVDEIRRGARRRRQGGGRDGRSAVGSDAARPRRRRDARHYRQHRRLPVRERFPIAGGLIFWLCAIGATALTILALARPTAAVSLVRTAGVDLVVLQDGSASMRTPDMPGDRWQRSIRFLRVLGESLAWKDDRMAMALFAHIAAPQVRLTKDPNTFFFFLDHLSQDSPFRMEDDTTWDTNIELGIAWGMRLIEKDTEIYGKSPNAKAFVLVTDGQAWSGEVARALKIARTNDVP